MDTAFIHYSLRFSNLYVNLSYIIKTNLTFYIKNLCYSLGITILELASDLDLPRGGDLWHQLRCGTLPEEFLLGENIIKYLDKPQTNISLA